MFSPWIKKETWSVFEDDSAHVSVHLKDFKPELFENGEGKKRKQEANRLYDEFKPEFISGKLKTFLKNNA